MKQVSLNEPPDPSDYNYKDDQMAYNKAVFRWMNESRQRIEAASHFNDVPMDQNFVLGSYVLTTSLAGTSTGTDITNFICSVVAAFTRKGLISIKPQTGDT